MHLLFVVILFVFLFSSSIQAAPKCRQRPPKHKHNRGIIAAIVVPTVFGAGLIGIGSVYLYRRIKSRRFQRLQKESPPDYTPIGVPVGGKSAIPTVHWQDEEAGGIKPSGVSRRRNKILSSTLVNATPSSVTAKESIPEIDEKSKLMVAMPTQEAEYEPSTPRTAQPSPTQTVQESQSSLHAYDEVAVKETIAYQIPPPQATDEFHSRLNTHIEDLQEFFPQNDVYLSTVAQKAALLCTDPTTDLGSPPHIQRLIRLSFYRLILYCDDSLSMLGKNYEIQCQLVSRIARIATKIVPNDVGVDLYFVSQGCFKNIKPDNISELLSSRQPSGETPIGTTLRSNILQPLVYYPLLVPDARLDHPLLICIITDGLPRFEPQDTLKRAIVECHRKLRAAGLQSTAVRFSINQIGSDPSAEQFLDALRGDPEIQDVVRCTTDKLDAKYEELRQNERELESWLLQVLTNPIMER